MVSMMEPLWFNAGIVTNGRYYRRLPLSSTDDHLRYHFRCVNLSEDDASEISESSVFHFRLHLCNLLTDPFFHSGVCMSFLSGEDWLAYSE